MQSRRKIIFIILVAMSPAGYAGIDEGVDALLRGDLEVAERELKPLAALGDRNAQYNLALVYVKSDPPDYEKAAKLFNPAAKAGNASASYMLGQMHEKGLGVPTSNRQALYWYRNAANLGHEKGIAAVERLDPPVSKVIVVNPKPERSDGGQSGTAGASILMLGSTAIGIYFLPAIIGFSRGHHNSAAIFLLNLFLGWTFLAWVAALVWSVTAVRSS